MASTKAAEFHCCYAANKQEALNKGRYIHSKYGKYLTKNKLIVDLGCGEGGFLLWLQQVGFEQVLGIERNHELCDLAKSFGVPVIQADIIEFVRSSKSGAAVYLYIDVMEHVSFDFNLELLSLIPVGSRVIIQTPYTRSILGHEFFMNLPSHVAPYSPWVVKKMLDRLGYDIASEGTVDGNHAINWKNKMRSFFIRKVFGIRPDMILAGGNYYVVADRVKDA